MVSSFAGRFGGLEVVGVQAVIKDLNKYLAGAQQVNAANASMARSAQAAALQTQTAAKTSILAQTRQLSFLTRFSIGAGATALIGGGSIRAAIQFEDAFAGVRKTVEGTPEQLAAIRQEIRDMAKELPVTTTEISEVAAAAGQLGVQTENVSEFTKTMLELGITTNLSATEAATSLARFTNVTGGSQRDVDRLGSAVVDLGNNLATTESEIVDFSLRIGGAGRIAGLSQADILGISGAFTSAGVQAEAGGTAVQKVLIGITQAVAEGNEDLDIFAATAGLSVEEFSKLWEEDAATAFERFVSGLGRQGDNAFKILEALGLQDQRLVRSFLAVAGTGDLLGDSLERSNRAFAENTALAEEAGKRVETTASQLQIFKNQVNDVAIGIGDALLPAFNAFLKGMQAIVSNKELTIAAIIAIGAAMVFAFGPASAAVAAIVGLIALYGQFEDKLNGIADSINKTLGLGSNQLELSEGELAQITGQVKATGTSSLLKEKLPGFVSDEEVARLAQQIAKENEAKLAQVEVTEASTDAFEDSSGTLDDWNEDFDSFLDGLDSSAEDAEEALKPLEDGIIDFAEAVQLGLDAVTAGGIEGQQLLADAETAAAAAAFNFTKKLAKVATAFQTSQRVAQQYVLTLAREAQAKTQAAASAIFGRPTREQANLQLRLAQINQSRSQAAIGAGNRLASLQQQLGGLEGTDRVDNQIRASQRLIDNLRNSARTTRNTNVRAEAERRLAAEEARLKGLEEEKSQEERRRSAIEKEIAAIEESLAVYDRQAEAVQRQLDLEQARTDLLQAELVAADQTLLTAAEQESRARELIDATDENTTKQRELTETLGVDVIPEMDDFREANALLQDSIRVLNDEEFRAKFIPNVDTAALRLSLLADAADNATTSLNAEELARADARARQANNQELLQLRRLGLTDEVFAQGGFVTGPRRVTVGEDGIEAIIPLNKPARARQLIAALPAGLVQGSTGAAGAAGNTYQISAQGMTEADLEPAIIRAVQRYFRQRRFGSTSAGALLANSVG